jgi:uroporphyrinogen-III synthase
MRVLVTRPAAQAAQWVARLQAHGIDAVALPLMGIAPVTDAAPVEAAWARLLRVHEAAPPSLVIFVSPNAAEQFFAHRPAHAGWPAAVWAGSPGPGTTHTLRGLGVPEARLIEPAAQAAQFDSESLWARLSARDWQGAEVLIVRGEGGGRDWLAATLRGHGAQVSHLAAYRRAAPLFSDAERALLGAARAAPARHLWLFSSSEAIDHLARALPGEAWAGAHAVATHPRIAQRAHGLGFSSVIEARPALDAVVACIQSQRP